MQVSGKWDYVLDSDLGHSFNLKMTIDLFDMGYVSSKSEVHHIMIVHNVIIMTAMSHAG